MLKAKNLLLFLTILFWGIIFVSCSGRQEKMGIPHAERKNQIDSEQKLDTPKIVFPNILGVVKDTNLRWINHGEFYGLQFKKDKVVFAFNPSCEYYFPFKINHDRIVVYWAVDMDCTFDRGLQEQFKNIKSPKIGDRFAEIALVDSLTLHISYLYKDWIEKLNTEQRVNIDTLFPNTFRVSKFIK